MTTGPVATITQREVRDTLSDWRIVVPMMLLTFILPLLLVEASEFTIRFVADEQLATRLVPFTALLVGFVPASFSIVTALESFVGERERNSLEALLSTPVDDRQLYISKLTASLATPLLSSYMAMIVFTSLLYLLYPDIYFSSMTVLHLAMLVISVGLMAVTMVAAAVVISSHISSIRAANLMSSFVLLPMALVVQMQAFLIINDRWEVLWFMIAALAVIAMLLIRIGVISFNREEILSREHQQFWNIKLPMFDLLGHFGGSGKASAEDETRRSDKIYYKTQQPVISIAGREIYEAITDWRLLLPVIVLTFVIPLALVGFTDFAIDFVGDPNLIARIVPFVMLMMGFIPASFSLIMALESFVGERERNTLESLLSMPVSDRALYLGKLLSSLIIPVITSYGAMLTFALFTALIHPELYFFSMTPTRLIAILLMIGAMSTVMVAGAVVISSHTGSIRAATLLASFILIPMSASILMQSVFIIGNRWDLLKFILGAFIVVTIGLIRTGMGAFSREEILSREHEELSVQRITDTFMTFFREYQPAGVKPEEYRGDGFAPMRFYRQEFPALLRELRYPIIVALIAIGAGLFGGIYVAGHYRIGALEAGFSQIRLGSTEPPGLLTVLIVFAQNLRVSILSNVFALMSFGLTAFLVMFIAYGQIGFIVGKLQLAGGSWLALNAASPLTFILAYVVPHGIIELPIFALSTALGIRIGASMMSPPQGFSVGQNILWSLANFTKVWLLIILPGVLAGSLVEGLISPWVIRALYGG